MKLKPNFEAWFFNFIAVTVKDWRKNTKCGFSAVCIGGKIGKLRRNTTDVRKLMEKQRMRVFHYDCVGGKTTNVEFSTIYISAENNKL